jgi:hypothetical protein
VVGVVGELVVVVGAALLVADLEDRGGGCFHLGGGLLVDFLEEEREGAVAETFAFAYPSRLATASIPASSRSRWVSLLPRCDRAFMSLVVVWRGGMVFKRGRIIALLLEAIHRVPVRGSGGVWRSGSTFTRLKHIPFYVVYQEANKIPFPACFHNQYNPGIGLLSTRNEVSQQFGLVY